MLLLDISRRIRYNGEISLWLSIIFTILTARNRLWATSTINILPISLLIPTTDTDHAGVILIDLVSESHDVPREGDTLRLASSKDGSRWTAICNDSTFAR